MINAGKVHDALLDLVVKSGEPLGIQSKFIYPTIQTLVPGTPAVFVTLNRIESNISGAPQFRHDHYWDITIFHSAVRSQEENYREAYEMGIALGHALNANSPLVDTNGNTLLVFGMVTKVEPSVATKENAQTMYRTVTLTYEGFELETMPSVTGL